MSTYQNVSGDYTITPSAGNVNIVGNVVASGLVQASYYIGDGQYLTGVVANVGAVSILQNGISNVNIPVSGGNVTFGVGGTGNVIVVSPTTANISVTTISTSNNSGALTVAGGVGVAGNVYADALYANNAPVLSGNSIIYGGTY